MRMFVVEDLHTNAATLYERPANDERETEVLVEVRSPMSISHILLSKDEAIALMEWLSEVTKD